MPDRLGRLDLNEAGPMLERMLTAEGLDTGRLVPADAWRVFSQWTRRAVPDADSDVVYVHIGIRDPTDSLLHLTLIRHLECADRDGTLDPVREIACDLAYHPGAGLADTGIELASLDHPALPDFLRAVEATPEFRAALRLGPAHSAVSWSEL